MDGNFFFCGYEFNEKPMNFFFFVILNYVTAYVPSVISLKDDLMQWNERKNRFFRLSEKILSAYTKFFITSGYC